ncbi:MAG TPA: hypothetical protein VFL64_22140 [Rhizobacter sp.]|nr:hypothetical protein [Rhizobacter sp.]
MCCGSKRAAAQAAAMAHAAPAAAFGARPALSVIMFEYLGSGQTAIRGPVSGQLYLFAQAGARVEVDARDRPGLAAMPSLRWVR